MRQYTTKTYVFVNKPTGGEIANIVLGDGLQFWSVSIERRTVEPEPSMMLTYKYLWDLKFTMEETA